MTAGPWEEPIEGEPVAAPSTGIDAVDGILAAVASYDWIALRQSAIDAMADLPPVACEVNPIGPGALECGPKDAPGDMISVFPLAYCEGALTRDPGNAVRAFLDGLPMLYAAVEAPSEPSQSELYRHGAYWIVYELPNLPGDAQQGARLHVTAAGDLTAIWYGCMPPLEELVEWEGEPLPEIEVREE